VPDREVAGPACFPSCHPIHPEAKAEGPEAARLFRHARRVAQWGVPRRDRSWPPLDEIM